MRLRASLFTRILFWSFLNLAAAGALLYGFFTLQFRLGPDSALFAGNRLQYVVARLGAESRGALTQDARDALLERYSATYDADFLLFNDDGAQLAGRQTMLPASVVTFIKEERLQTRPGPRGPEGDRAAPPDAQGGPPPGELPGMRGRTPPSGLDLGPAGRGPGAGGRDGMGPPGQAIFRERTTNPTRYWVVVRTPLFEPGERRPTMAALIVVSDSMSGRGLFFDVRPWVFVAAAILLLSAAIWFPFVRGLTRSIGQMTSATEQIARGRFDTAITTRRSDELGRLATAINQLSGRLAGFVHGQRRFLGDISHELNSPLARIEVALGILEEQVGETDRRLVADAQEDVRLMSQLVSELLAFAKAGMKAQDVRLSSVPIRRVCEAVVTREAQGREVSIDVEPELEAVAQPQLLARALANLVRNALRYAGQAGPIEVVARAQGDEVAIAVRDRGPGVPAEAMPRLFEPFFRIEADRDRATGGAGLGLAIVKTCVDACQGTVQARNLSPGFEVEIRLRRG